MKYGKSCLLLLMLIVLFAESSFAVELQVLVIGHGYVQGENFSCVENCTKSYVKGTVIHFKALPFPDSKFSEWKVNGAPHEGVITLNEDTVISAIFERTNDPMLEDGMTVYWYDGYGGRDYATIAPDEILIKLKKLDTWGGTEEAEYQDTVEEILQTFHPQAEISKGSRTLLYLKSSELLEKEQWFKALINIQQFPQVDWASPVFYTTPGASWTQLDIGKAIFVYFPANYTESQIAVIEQEYGLVRTNPIEEDNRTLYVLHDPLEAIEFANRLYESGQVELATPLINTNAIPMSEPNDPLLYDNGILKVQKEGILMFSLFGTNTEAMGLLSLSLMMEWSLSTQI